MNEENGGIYLIKNLLNNKVYIGSTINFDVRWRTHYNDLKRNRHHSILLQRAWNKYGEGNFVCEILERIEDKELLVPIEQKYLSEYSPDYNICLNAGNCLGRKFSKESRKKMSISHTGKTLSKEHKQKISKAISGEKNPFYGKKHSLETRQLIKVKRASQNFSIETRQKLSKVNAGEKNKAARPVISTNIISKEEKHYSYISLAKEDGFKTPNAITKCCNGIKASYKNHFWRWA